LFVTVCFILSACRCGSPLGAEISDECGWFSRNRRIAYVEPTDEKGRSRWIGEGQFLSFRVCQAIRRVLVAETIEPCWSQRAMAQIGEIRLEYPWVSHDHTALVQQANGEVQWWTFAGGLANSIVMDHLGDRVRPRS
jgi:ATP-dependent Lhr-like helicase